VSESELMEIGQALWGNSISVIAIYLTVLSGYLIVAYTAGAAMNSSQIRIINILYIGLSIFLLFGTVAFAINASEVDSLAFAMTTQRKIVPTPYFAYVISFFLIFCHLASLKFMKDLRRENGA
jgi:hypothetical protein